MARSVLLPLLAVLLLPSTSAAAGGPQPFHPDSLDQIVESREGRPFLLVLWSVTCPPCIKELGLLEQARADHPDLDVVLISTDGPDGRAEAQEILEHFELGDTDNWIFSDGPAVRLRHRIDPDWFGELPRTYFYDADHRRESHSGALPPDRLAAWIESAVRP